MKIPFSPRARRSSGAGFTLIEVMMSTMIVGLVMGLSLNAYINGMKIMYKDSQRLATNATLREFIAHMAAKTLDATNFYVFPNYQSFDGSVNLSTDPTTLATDACGTYIANGDCLLLVSLTDQTNAASNIQEFCIYYRVTTSTETQAPIWFYDSGDFGPGGTSTPLATLLNAVNLKTNPYPAGAQMIVPNALGRLMTTPAPPTYHYPIFMAEAPNSQALNAAVSINVNIINGSSADNILSSSSFNYTVSPR